MSIVQSTSALGSRGCVLRGTRDAQSPYKPRDLAIPLAGGVASPSLGSVSGTIELFEVHSLDVGGHCAAYL
jgi:hypothetical protein